MSEEQKSTVPAFIPTAWNEGGEPDVFTPIEGVNDRSDQYVHPQDTGPGVGTAERDRDPHVVQNPRRGARQRPE
jgi:hypothetical protein